MQALERQQNEENGKRDQAEYFKDVVQEEIDRSLKVAASIGRRASRPVTAVSNERPESILKRKVALSDRWPLQIRTEMFAGRCWSTWRRGGGRRNGFGRQAADLHAKAGAAAPSPRKTLNTDFVH
jgi:hypothetical protein